MIIIVSFVKLVQSSTQKQFNKSPSSQFERIKSNHNFFSKKTILLALIMSYHQLILKEPVKSLETKTEDNKSVTDLPQSKRIRTFIYDRLRALFCPSKSMLCSILIFIVNNGNMWNSRKKSRTEM